MNFDKRQQNKKRRRQKMPQIAFSSYSGSIERCGDSCGWSLISDGKVAVALSDGMGKGEYAARESERAVNSILPLLKADMAPEMALQVLNLLWSMSNRKERFPTLDLALLDPARRELAIYKTGAAPTIIVRVPRCRPEPTGNTYRNSAPSVTCLTKLYGQVPIEQVTQAQTEIFIAPAMPMGVSENSEIPCISTMVMPGDRIVMMTDGIADSRRNDPEMGWLCRLLTRIKSRNPQTVCDLIVREAVLNYGDREKDDMTVVVFNVK